MIDKSLMCILISINLNHWVIIQLIEGGGGKTFVVGGYYVVA